MYASVEVERLINYIMLRGQKETARKIVYSAFEEIKKYNKKFKKISAEALKNRAILLGIMTASGWDFYRNEWWHYQLFDSKYYPLIFDKEHNIGMM